MFMLGSRRFCKILMIISGPKEPTNMQPYLAGWLKYRLVEIWINPFLNLHNTDLLPSPAGCPRYGDLLRQSWT